MAKPGQGQALGVADLLRGMSASGRTLAESPDGADHWYWCRRHECAEHVGEPARPIEDCPPNCKMPGEHVHRDCIRVGPFMSEREANRLNDVDWCDADERGVSPLPLGMQVEL